MATYVLTRVDTVGDHTHSWWSDRWHDFWEVFWNFGHASSEIVWEIISIVLASLIVRPLLRRHDRKHHGYGLKNVSVTGEYSSEAIECVAISLAEDHKVLWADLNDGWKTHYRGLARSVIVYYHAYLESRGKRINDDEMVL